MLERVQLTDTWCSTKHVPRMQFWGHFCATPCYDRSAPNIYTDRGNRVPYILNDKAKLMQHHVNIKLMFYNQGYMAKIHKVSQTCPCIRSCFHIS